MRKRLRSSLGITRWAFAHVLDQPSIDIEESMTLGDRAAGNCTAIDASNAVDAMRQSRRRRMELGSLGVQTVQLLDAAGALDSVIEKIQYFRSPPMTTKVTSLELTLGSIPRLK